jgi:hypothetical protein
MPASALAPVRLSPGAFAALQSVRTPTPPPVTRSNGHAEPRGDLSVAARKILGVLAQFPEGCVAGKITLLAGYRYTGAFRNALSELRTAGFITRSLPYVAAGP